MYILYTWSVSTAWWSDVAGQSSQCFTSGLGVTIAPGPSACSDDSYHSNHIFWKSICFIWLYLRGSAKSLLDRSRPVPWVHRNVATPRQQHTIKHVVDTCHVSQNLRADCNHATNVTGEMSENFLTGSCDAVLAWLRLATQCPVAKVSSCPCYSRSLQTAGHVCRQLLNP